MSEEQPHANLSVPAFRTENVRKTQTQNGHGTVWRFGGSDKAAVAATVTLRGVIYMLFDNCSKDVKKTILPLGHGDPSVYPCFRTCIEAEDAVVDVLRSGKGNSYGPGAGILPARRAVADYMNRDLPNKLTPDDIFLTAGCNQGIEIVFESLARPNANILLPRPGFPHYDARASYSGLCWIRTKNIEKEMKIVESQKTVELEQNKPPTWCKVSRRVFSRVHSTLTNFALRL